MLDKLDNISQATMTYQEDSLAINAKSSLIKQLVVIEELKKKA